MANSEFRWVKSSMSDAAAANTDWIELIADLVVHPEPNTVTVSVTANTVEVPPETTTTTTTVTNTSPEDDTTVNVTASAESNNTTVNITTPPSKTTRTADYLSLLGMVVLGGYIGFLGVDMWRHKPGASKPEVVVVTTPAPVVVLPPSNPESFAQVLEVKPYYLRAKRVDGKIVLHTGGSAAWRYNNMGKLVNGDFTRSMGSLGSDGKIALFADYAAGRKAAETLLFETPSLGFSTGTVAEAISKWAERDARYNPVNYARDVAKAAGVEISTKMSTLTPDQRQKFLDEVKVQEGYLSGRVVIFENDEDFKKRGY